MTNYTVHGFALVEERQIVDINSLARVFRHEKTGARLLSLENDDENKVFCISFATPPEDSTGLPHILEHSVLCGSHSYPVKEPFKELRKGSLNTFLNAFTAPDRTVYPVASQNLQDFYNLASVYLDAVFKPFLTPETLLTQGWHYEAAGPDSPLTYKGVVFNEMKGVYSSPDSLIGRYTQQSLFPDTVYHLDSGGNPAEIPNLTYEQFRAFHQRYYHPSNAAIFFYGDDHSDERLRLVDAYLSQFDAAAAAPPVAVQPRLSEIRRFVYSYDAGQVDDPPPAAGSEPRRSYVTVNWLLNEITDLETTLILQILSHTLVGSQASPLRKALVDSGLGDDLTGGGYSPYYRQAVFSTGLKGIAAGDAEKVEALVLDTLSRLASEGIDPDMVAASLNTAEFRLREANTGAFPRGLMFVMSAAPLWQHGADPLDGLAFEERLAAVKRRLADDPRAFESLIRRHLLENPHRTVVLLQPDPEARARAEAAERDRLDRARAAMSPADVQKVLATMERLQAAQELPDSPEALAAIPSLHVADLDRAVRRIPAEEGEVGGARLLTHDLFTNGIVYLDLAFDLRSLPQPLLPYGELFGRLLLSMGAGREDYVKLSQRIGRTTGGIGRTLHATTTRAGQPSARLILRGKATLDRGPALLEILRDVLLTARLDDPARLRQIVLEEKAGMEASLIPGGHQVVLQRLRARYSVAGWVAEQTGGIDYLLFLRRLVQRIDADWPGVLADLEAVRGALVRRSGLLCNVTLDDGGLQSFLPQLAGLVQALPAGTEGAAEWTPAFSTRPEGLAIPSQVNYVGKAANLYDLGYRLAGSVFVAVKYLDNTWMWDRVRVQGGAYGGFLTFDNLSGVLAWLSYRDPNLLQTLHTFDATPGHLRAVSLTQADVNKLIIGVIGQFDGYQLPDAKGFTSLVRTLTGDSDALRQRLRDEVLATTVADVRAFAEVLDEATRAGSIAVLGASSALSQASQSLESGLDVMQVL